MQGSRFIRFFSSSARAASHVGSAPISLPPSITVSPADGLLTIAGPKGSQQIPLAPFIRLAIQSPSSLNPSTSSAPALSKQMIVSVEDPNVKVQRAAWGLSRALIANAITGLTEGFAISLKLIGVGFRAAVEDDPFAGPNGPNSGLRLNIKLNFAHNVLVPIPRGIVATTPQPTKIVLRGTDKQQVGQFAAKIRAWRKPEPYKGKVRSS
jgi:large subunit ribosomal protein L6